MAYTTHSNSIINKEFFKPLFESFQHAKHRRDCSVFNDSTWLEAGVRRCLGTFQSGRDFLQNLADKHDTEIRISTFFESLKSQRRLALLDEVLKQLRGQMSRTMPDSFSEYKCLKDFDIFAGDGHFVAAACHDKAKPYSNSKSAKSKDATTRPTSTKYATGHLYALNLRNHAMSHLTVADQITRKKEHEMRALKRQTADTLRQGAAKGRKVLYIWDPAGIDFRQWLDWKTQSGIYFLSKEKENMKLEVMGENPYDAKAVGNTGIQADQIVATSTGVSVRRVIYRDPETATIYRYLTNLPVSIQPGLIELLYKSRWDIEKVFDEFKNKLSETKSWASSAVAKTNQARLLCLTHNLLTLMEEIIWQREGVRNYAELKRKEKERKVRFEKQKNEKGGTIPHLNHAAERLTQRTVKFIRWLGNHLDSTRSWERAIASLNKVYQHS